VRRFQWALILVFLFSMILAGCTTKESSTNESKLFKALNKDDTAAITVMYYDENSFFQQFGNLFLSKFPNVDIKVISTQPMYKEGNDPQKAFYEFVEKEKPDVIMMDINQYEKMAADGKLLALDSVIKKDKFDVENILPAITDILRSKGNGQLFGLSSSFYSNALYYNKDLFDQNGVPYPKDQMSWEEVLELAKRFPTTGEEDKRIYGLYQNSYGQASVYQFINMIGTTEGLTMVDPESLKVTIDTGPWKKVFQTSIDALRSKAMNPAKQPNSTNSANSYEDYMKSNLFTMGRAAMTIDSYYAIQQMKQAQDQIKDLTPVNWDVVTVPVNPSNPDFSSSVGVSNLFAINAQSENQRTAWEFVKYLNSDELAKIFSRSSQNLLGRTKYIKDKDGHSLEAFYKLKSNTDMYKGYEKIPMGFHQMINSIVDTGLQPVLDDKISLDEALKSIQLQAQDALDKAKVEADSKKETAVTPENTVTTESAVTTVPASN
jgi:multiple sugar transport system substrate-binding protein